MISCQLDQKLKLSDECVICGRTLSMTGGHRIISQKFRGIGFSTTHIGGGNKDVPYVSKPLNESKTLFLVFWGEAGFWSDDAMSKAIKMYKDSLHPYFCSYCGKRTCTVCGQPLMSPVGSDYMYDDGGISHAPILPAKIPCMNEGCVNSRRDTIHKD